MKIVLTEDVDKLGIRGDVVTVANGYARNFLLPQALALEATAGNLKGIEQQRRAWAVKEAKEADDAREVAARLSAVEVTVKKLAGENNTLYGSVTSSEIADLLAEQGVQVDRRRIRLAEPIKALGTVDVPIKLHRGVVGTIKVHVLSEQGHAAVAAEPEAPEAAAQESETPEGASTESE